METGRGDLGEAPDSARSYYSDEDGSNQEPTTGRLDDLESARSDGYGTARTDGYGTARTDDVYTGRTIGAGTARTEDVYTARTDGGVTMRTEDFHSVRSTGRAGDVSARSAESDYASPREEYDEEEQYQGERIFFFGF